MVFEMATNMPLSPGGRQELKMPMPPPLLHTRSGNEIYEGPQTPTHHSGFTTPVQTPQGSPSKSRVPPGANELPNVFDNAMKLAPTSPTKSGRPQPNSPSKQGLSVSNDNIGGFNESVLEKPPAPGSPTRNKENTPPGGFRPGKDLNIAQNQAAVSRQEPYQQMDGKKTQTVRGLTPEELEKLQLPKVRRLANVTQLCKYICHHCRRTNC